MAGPAKEPGFSMAGVAIFCVLAGAIYLGLIYPVYRLVHPMRADAPGSAAAEPAGDGPIAGFGPGWTCQGPLRALVCWLAPLPGQSAGSK
jgi:hypothetical protein